jgi:hypothetical protein
VTLGLAERQGGLFNVAVQRCAPDNEVICAAEVGAANAGDAAMAQALLADLPARAGDDASAAAEAASAEQPAAATTRRRLSTATAPTGRGRCWPTWTTGPVHQQRGRTDHHHPPTGDPTAGGQSTAARAGLAGRYRAHRPTVERKLAHLLRRRHGGRRARVRGLLRIGQDWRLLAAAVNLARFAVPGVHSRPGGRALTPP